MAMTVGDNTVVVNGVNLGTLIANGDASVVDPSTPGYPKGTQGWDPTTNQATLSGSTISGAGAGVPEDAILSILRYLSHQFLSQMLMKMDGMVLTYTWE